MPEARRREGVGFCPRPSNDAASGKHPRRRAKQKRRRAHRRSRKADTCCRVPCARLFFLSPNGATEYSPGWNPQRGCNPGNTIHKIYPSPEGAADTTGRARSDVFGAPRPKPSAGPALHRARPAAPCSPDLTILRKSSIVSTTSRSLAGCRWGSFLSEATSSARLLAAVFHKTAFATSPVCALCMGGFAEPFTPPLRALFRARRSPLRRAPPGGSSPRDPRKELRAP